MGIEVNLTLELGIKDPRFTLDSLVLKPHK